MLINVLYAYLLDILLIRLFEASSSIFLNTSELPLILLEKDIWLTDRWWIYIMECVMVIENFII